MTGPTVEVLGVYKLPITDELVDKAVAKYSATDTTPSARDVMVELVTDELAATVLFEIRVLNVDRPPEMDNFCQPDYEVDPENFQVAYSPVFLSPDGETVLATDPAQLGRADEYRVAFYLHFFQPDMPLDTGFGKVLFPRTKDMPDRLKKLAPYKVPE
ncbi:MAG: hypothetical protein ACLFOY_04120 [Desulfatibacillaceae bacterium]